MIKIWIVDNAKLVKRWSKIRFNS